MTLKLVQRPHRMHVVFRGSWKGLIRSRMDSKLPTRAHHLAVDIQAPRGHNLDGNEAERRGSHAITSTCFMLVLVDTDACLAKFIHQDTLCQFSISFSAEQAHHSTAVPIAYHHLQHPFANKPLIFRLQLPNLPSSLRLPIKTRTLLLSLSSPHS